LVRENHWGEVWGEKKPRAIGGVSFSITGTRGTKLRKLKREQLKGSSGSVRNKLIENLLTHRRTGFTWNRVKSYIKTNNQGLIRIDGGNVGS